MISVSLGESTERFEEEGTSRDFKYRQCHPYSVLEYVTGIKGVKSSTPVSVLTHRDLKKTHFKVPSL